MSGARAGRAGTTATATSRPPGSSRWVRAGESPAASGWPGDDCRPTVQHGPLPRRTDSGSASAARPCRLEMTLRLVSESMTWHFKFDGSPCAGGGVHCRTGLGEALKSPSHVVSHRAGCCRHRSHTPMVGCAAVAAAAARRRRRARGTGPPPGLAVTVA